MTMQPLPSSSWLVTAITPGSPLKASACCRSPNLKLLVSATSGDKVCPQCSRRTMNTARMTHNWRTVQDCQVTPI
jgi:hypothetical protein